MILFVQEQVTECSPIRRFVYIKTHKTASTTVKSVLHEIIKKLRLRTVSSTYCTYYVFIILHLLSFGDSKTGFLVEAFPAFETVAHSGVAREGATGGTRPGA